MSCHLNRRASVTRSGAGLKPIAPNWAPRPILHTLVQVDWEPGSTEIGPTPPKAGPASSVM